MSFEDDELEPEEYFEMITIMPKRKVKMVAHLEDQDGSKILLSTIAEKMKDHINKHMKSSENSPINSQLFPLINQMMISAVPRHVNISTAAFLFTARESRYALSMFGLQIALLMRYIDQNKLKVVCTEHKISQEQVDEYLAKEEEASLSLHSAVMGKAEAPNDHEIN